MKNKLILFLSVLLFHLIVANDTNDPLLNFQFLMLGADVNPFDETLEFMLYHYVLNLGLMTLFLMTVLQAVSQAFEMRDYIITRRGYLTFKLVLLKTSLKNIFTILLIKQLIYLAFFAYARKFTIFYFYDMGSTFLTLLMFAQCFTFFKLLGAKDKVPLFVIAGIYMISQMLSFEHPAFSVIVIAGFQWQSFWLINMIGKTAAVLLVSGLIYLQKDLDKMLGVKDG